jgi:lactobin A/cerein 7B family class IIb bacteriocin
MDLQPVSLSELESVEGGWFIIAVAIFCAVALAHD